MDGCVSLENMDLVTVAHGKGLSFKKTEKENITNVCSFVF